MSEPDKDGDSGSANRSGPPPEKFQFRVIAVWVTIIGLLGVLYFNSGRLPSQQQAAQPLTLQKVLEHVEKGEIKAGSAIIRGDSTFGIQELSFQLTDAAAETPAGADASKSKKAATLTLETAISQGQFEKLTAAGFRYERATTMAKELLSSLLVFALVIGLLYFLFVRQIKSAGRTAMSFGKSRAKMLAKEGTKITFKDVAGCDEAKEEVSEVVDFLKDPKKYQKMGARIPKGVLLVGPPGTGKTLLARAVAGEADVPFFSISGSDFVEMFVGVGAARVRDMFEQGRKNAPCIIFIDEIDAVGRKRGHGHGGGNDEREQTLNSILVEMDGFDAQEGIIIIAATNRADVLDAALLRPGRFDRQVNVDLPDLNGRVEILRVHAKKIKLAADVDLKDAARGTSGFSGADLANLLNEAALLAARHNRTEVNLRHISDARDKISFGLERRKLMDEEDKKSTAWHEAGHALVQATLDKGKHPVYQVTILPRGRTLGMMMFYPTKDILSNTKDMSETNICCAMAGRVAEDIAFGEVSSGASGDIFQATQIARKMVCEWGMSPLGMVNYSKDQTNPEYGDFGMIKNYSDQTANRIDELVREIIDRQYARAKEICLANRAKLDAIAEALIKYETILGLHVMEIMEFGEIRTPVEQATAKPHKEGPPPLKKPSTAPETGLGPAPTPSPFPA